MGGSTEAPRDYDTESRTARALVRHESGPTMKNTQLNISAQAWNDVERVLSLLQISPAWRAQAPTRSMALRAMIGVGLERLRAQDTLSLPQSALPRSEKVNVRLGEETLREARSVASLALSGERGDLTGCATPAGALARAVEVGAEVWLNAPALRG